MTNISTFDFQKDKIKSIKNNRFGEDWPVVYLIENGKEAYIGESHNVYNRSLQHIKNKDRAKLHKIHLIGDEKYNKSATLDTESLLIQYISADGKFKLQNSNKGLLNHDYFDRERYLAKFEVLWEELKKMKLVANDLVQLKNSDLFKYSPYKALTTDQLIATKEIVRNIKKLDHKLHLVSGRPGTGKTILAIYLFKLLTEIKETKDLKVGLVIPMSSLRQTIKSVFKKIKGLKANMVLGPSDTLKNKYDILIVDEAHRLKQRKNITNYQTFDQNNKILELGKDGTELDWILLSSKTQVLFFDENQTVKPSDISVEKVKEKDSIKYELVSQLRVKAGEGYIDFIDDFFDQYEQEHYALEEYDLKLFTDIESLQQEIKNKNKEHGLSRLVAGYAWSWKTKKGKQDFDIEIDGLKLKWNSKLTDWVNSPNAIDEVGCIHTVQGYDLNYTGVIIGPEIYLDEKTKKIKIDKSKYMDINGRKGIEEPKQLEKYIKNIYKTLMTRGIKGTYVYIVDKNLRNYFAEKVNQVYFTKDAEVKISNRSKLNLQKY